MIKHIRQVSIIATTLLLATLTQAQSAMPSPQPQSSRMVYVLNFDQEGAASRDDIDDFAEQLLILRLGQIKTYHVERRGRDNEPRCVPEVEGTSNDAQPVTIGSDANHYLIKAVITVREPEKATREAVLNYKLLKCRKDGSRISLANSNYTFPYTEMLRHLNGMADAISFLLEQEQEVTRIAVDFKGVSGTMHGARLGESILARLKEAQEFEPRDSRLPTPQGTPAEYSISGRVFSQGTKLWFEVDVRNRRGQSFKKVFDGPMQTVLADAQKLEDFNKEMSLLAVDYLTFVRNVVDTEQPPPSALEAEKALRQARELLCKSEPLPAECSPQASPAADLLTEVVRNKKFDTFGTRELLSGALLQAGENSRAAESFEKAAKLADLEGKGVAVADLLSQAGSAWLEARNYSAAESAYERLLKLSPSRLDAYLGKAKSYRYNNERLKALEFLLDSLTLLPEEKALKDELEFLINTLQPSEIESAMRILNGKKEKPSATIALSLLRRTQAGLILLDAFGHFANARYEAMDTELRKVEEFANQLPESSEETILLMEARGFWHREARGEFDTALRLFLEARRRAKDRGNDVSSDLLALEIGRTLLKRGKARTDRSEARRNFEEASSILTETAKKRGGSDTLSLLRIVNHELGRDKETRELIQHRVDEGRASLDDLLSLGFICNSYFADPECGLKVAAALKESRISGAEAYSSLLRAEALTLKGEYDLALSAQQEAVRLAQPSTIASAVAHFYGVLLHVAKVRQFKGTDSMEKWQLSIRGLREAAGEGIWVEGIWVFDGALRILEADPLIAANAKAVLRDMIAAMQDDKKALPELPPDN